MALTLVAIAVTACSSGGQAGTAIKRAAGWFAGAIDEAQALKVLGSNASKSEVEDLIAATKKAESSGLKILLPLAGKSLASAFADDLPRYENQVVTVTGHNEAGLLKFSDGTSIHVGKLAALNPNIKIAVVSCSSLKLLDGTAMGLPTKVASDVAALTEEKFAVAAAGLGSDVPVLELQQMLDDAFNAAKSEIAFSDKVTYLKYTAVGTGGTVGAIALISIYEAHP